jgi:hypothetical protein
MRTLIGLLAMAFTGSTTAVFAMEPPAATPPPQMSPPTATTPAEISSTKSTADSRPDQAAKVTLTAGDAAAAAELKRLKAAGYQPETHAGEIWFCRKEAVIGTRLEKKVCNTADQLLRQEADARQMTDHIQRRISGDPRDGGHP